MSLPWLWWKHDPMVIAGPVVQQKSPVIGQKQVDEDLFVEFKHIKETNNPQVVTFTEGVKAIYGVTTIRCDELTLYMDQGQRRGRAAGHVKLDDPAGTATAGTLDFSWKDKTGVATEVHANVGGVMIDARRGTIRPGIWELFDLSATNSANHPPIYMISGNHATIEPGKKITFQSPRLSVLGKHIFTFPTYTASLDQRAPGVGLPQLSYRADRGPGLGWSAATLLNDRTAFAGSFSVFRRFPPTYKFIVSRTFLGPEESDQLIIPPAEMDERFRYSYFDNISIGGPGNDEHRLRAPRKTLAIGTYLNAVPHDRDAGASYALPADLVYELSGAEDEFGYYGLARIQSIRRGNGALHTRAVMQATLDELPIILSKNLAWHWRADWTAYLGDTAFGWVRGETGLSFRPNPHLTFGSGAFAAMQGDNNVFPSDRLQVRNGYVLRGDLNFGPTRFGALTKYDLVNHKWYDREFTITQAMGCFESYFVYRKFPSDYRYGLRLRLEPFFGAIKHRKVQRPVIATQSIDPAQRP